MLRVPIFLFSLLFLVGCTANLADAEADLTPPPMTTPSTDAAAVEALITELFQATDDRRWDNVRATMADSVYVDYSALGGEPGLQTPQQIVGGWEQLLPGFDRTTHQLHNFSVWTAGDRATATFDAIATHVIPGASGGDDWTVFVGYDTEFTRTDGRWKLARIDLSLYDQQGNENLPQTAMSRVQSGQVQPFSARSTNTATLEKFFTALEQTDLTSFLNTFGEDAIQRMPLAPGSFPKELRGKDALRGQYTGVMDYEQRYERIYLPTSDPNTVIAKYRGIITTGEGKPYNNHYVGVFRFNDNGKIERFTEYFNPDVLLAGWPGLQPATYSVHDAGAATDSGVELTQVSFPSNGVTLRGHLFTPPNFDESETYPTAIVTGSWTSVKEQMPDEYASLLAKKGFVALTFDFTGFGESDGQPRQVEDYELKIADIRAAVDYLAGHKNVDQSAITGLGVCASSGYMAHAVAQDKRVDRLVLVAPWLHDAEIARGLYDARPGGTDGLLASAKEAADKYARTGEMDYVLAASELDPLSAMYVPENAFDYYLDPAKAAGKFYDNRFAVTSWEPWLTFDGISAGKDITQPVFIVHSESGAVPQGAKAFYDHLQGEKKIEWLNQFDQQQLYFRPEAVNAAMDAVGEYLSQNGKRVK